MDSPDKERCRTCRHWNQGGEPLASMARSAGTRPDYLGTCEIAYPTVLIIGNVARGYFPETHADRGCSNWEGEEEPDDGEREDIPDTVVSVDFEQRKVAA